MTTQELIYSILVKDEEKPTKWQMVYDGFMFAIIMLSIVPLMFAHEHAAFFYTEALSVTVFIIDYFLRWYIAPLTDKRGPLSYIRYPFTWMAIIDLLSILPVVSLIDPSFKLLRFTRLIKIMRLLKITRYSSKISTFVVVLKKEREMLLSVLALALFYIFLTALIMYNCEPHVNPYTGKTTFASFFDALYWATVTLTTVGYGDLCPVTDIGRVVSMLSSLLGLAVIALPSGVITASYLDELRERKSRKEKDDNAQAAD